MKKVLKGLALSLAVAFVGIMMCACVPANVEKAEARFEEASYKVVAYSTEDATKVAEGAIGGFTASKATLTDGIDVITAIVFDSKKAAKAFYEKHIGDASEDDDTIIKTSGKWVYMGTEAAVEVFEG